MVDSFIFEGKSVWVAGANGMVGSAIIRSLSKYDVELHATTRKDVNLVDPTQVQAFYEKVRPNVVILAAAKVGGIHANATYPVDFISDNLQIQQNVISGAQRNSVKKLLFLGSSCIYPRDCPQPIKEEYLLTGNLEPTNEWYAIAKIAGIKLCQAYRKQYGCDFISAMPTNLYGPNDNFHPENSHVPAALLSRFHEAKVKGVNSVSVWGTGKPCREFLHAQTPDKTNLTAVPVLGMVAAGQPILTLENKIGQVMVPNNVLRGKCFALKVQGDSMIDADIFEGDYVVVRQQPIAENSDIVVAMVGEEATVKRLSIEGEHIELRPENQKLKPIIIGQQDELKIIGKVLYVCSGVDTEALLDEPQGG